MPNNNSLARALIRELRANFKSYAVRDAGENMQRYIIINHHLRMISDLDPAFWKVHYGCVKEDDILPQGHATIEELRKALKLAIQRRSTHARKRVERISVELARGEQIIAAIEQQDNERLEALLCESPYTPA